LVAFFLKLIRLGLYFPPEQFFFIFIYIINYRESKNEGTLTQRNSVQKVSSRLTIA
jgi:hypothetical protein